MKKEVIVDIRKAYILSIVLFFIPFIALAMLQVHLHTEYYFRPSWLSLIYIILVIPLHEGLHAIGFLVFSKAPRESVKFGFHKEYLTPYCHCSNFENTKFGYISTMMLPNIILIIISVEILFLTNNLFWSLIAAFVISSGAGDYYMAYLVSKYKNTTKFIDHPTEPGFFMIE